MGSFQQELAIIKTIVEEINQYLKKLPLQDLAVQIKEDGSPVTNVDIEINRMIHEKIITTFPQDGWLSEETPDNATRLDRQRVWAIDPIDGTKPFIKSLPQFSISIALIEEGKPILGVIFNQATQECFLGIHGIGSTLNGQPIHVRTSPHVPLRLLVNPWQVPKQTLHAWRQQADCHLLFGSIAYSLALVASGQIDGVVNVGRQNEWDIAAAHGLIQAAGGFVLDSQEQPISCNKPQPIVNGIIAGSPDALPRIQRLLQLTGT